MSSFFTAPASQRKRKRDDNNAAPSTKRRNTSTKKTAKPVNSKPARARRDDSISSSGSQSEDRRKRLSDEEDLSDSESEAGGETGAERRLRLAEAYLRNIKGEAVDEVGFDAADVDADIIATRLQEDVAETKSKLHRRIASTLDFLKATKTRFRYSSLTTSNIATCAPYAYTVSKDIQLIKWELPTPPSSPANNPRPPKESQRTTRQRPNKLIGTRGDRNMSGDTSYRHHTAPILCVAASSTGKFVATGGADKRLIIWSAESLTPLRVFTQHRDAVTSLAFRIGTNQLYSASKDRTIKTWSLDELAYVETLFGHQDEVVDVAALGMERCVSVGARDRTARVWRIVEETQLVFRGGGSSEKKRPKKDDTCSATTSYNEGSIDRVAFIDEDTFVTGSDNGSLSLWSLLKKKPVFTIPLAHGLDPAMEPEEYSANVDPGIKVPERQPRWITALATVPLSDLIVSGSWDGQLRLWRVSEDKKKLESFGSVGKPSNGPHDAADGNPAEEEEELSISGYINDLSVFERGERGRDGLCIVAAVGSEPRLGRWKTVKGRNGAVVFEIPKFERMVEDALVENKDGL